ncbi:MAG: CehA/McbA family metallohydrolase [Bryobacteraceae bacterium]
MRFPLLALALAAGLFAERGKFASGYMYSYYVPQSASTPWRPAWSPDGDWVAFAMSGSIWRIAVKDGVAADTAYELTAGSGYDSSPSWSPDGRWIVYTSEDASGRETAGVNLMLLNVATGESTALTRGNTIHLDAVFSPDGRRILYTNNQPRNAYHVYAMPFDNGRTGAPQQITEQHSFGRERLYFSTFDDHISPTVSPDGKEMILVSNRGIPLGSGAIWRAPLAPDAMGKARVLLREETLYRTQPQWSPDGNRILYSSHRGSQYNNLYVLPVDGGEPYQLTFGAWDRFDPRWSPDGEWIAYISNRRGASELHLLRTFGGEDNAVEIRRRVHRRPMGRLVVSFPGAARFYLVAADGKSYAPPTAYQRVAGRYFHDDFFHAENEFAVDLPVGEAALEAVHGLEHHPLRRAVRIEAGSVATVDLHFDRLTDMNAAGWWSGSDHVHMNYAGNLHNTPENLMMMARAEDLNMIGDKVCNKDHRIFDHEQFTGKPHALSNASRLLTFNEEYRPPFYGHINFINLTRHLISPFTTGYEDSAIGSLYPSNTDMFRLARKQGAIGGYVHPWSRDPEAAGYAVARGFPVDVALGAIEYLEVHTAATYFTHTAPVWHRALNCGFRVTASGGEDSILSLHATPIIGSNRLYAYLGDKLEWSRWVDAVRAGRTFVTNGPLIRIEANGEIPGGDIRLDAPGAVEVKGIVESIVPLEKIEIFVNGRVAETIPAEGGAAGVRLPFSKRIAIRRSGWITVRASHSKPQRPVDDSYIVGETSPVYVTVAGRPARSKADAEYFIRWIDAITRMAEAHPGWRTDRERRHVLEQFAEARRVFVERAVD